MNLLHWILNIAALFLWIDWRTGQAAKQPQPLISLASALRATTRNRARGWGSLAGFAGLVLLRPLVYQTIGSALNWTPTIEVMGLTLSWRSNLFDRIFAYSTISFALTLGYYYGCLLFLDTVRPQAPEAEGIQRFIRAQLGWLARLPWFCKVLLPFLAAGLAWAALVPILVWLGLMPAVPAAPLLWTEAGILAIASILAWRWFFAVFFLLYLLNTYVYFGNHPFWNFVAATGTKLLKPLSSLRIGKVEFAPFVAIALLFAASELLIRPASLQMFERTLK
jgi:hypothetical protein